jgi:hypothetical protein
MSSWDQIFNPTMESNRFGDGRPPSELAEADTDKEDSPFIAKKPDERTQCASPWHIIPWSLFFIFAFLFMREKYLSSTRLDTFASGFATEFGKLIPNLPNS